MSIQVLHLLHSEPDAMARRLIGEAYPAAHRILVPLYAGNDDYEQLVGQIFDSDRIISWWPGERHSDAKGSVETNG